MEGVNAFCNKTAEKVSSEITATESKFNQNLQHEEQQAIHETLKYNDKFNSKFFQRKQNKKFNYLKFQPKQNAKSERFFEKEQNTQK